MEHIKLHLKVYTLLRISFEVWCRPGNQQQSRILCIMALDENRWRQRIQKTTSLGDSKLLTLGPILNRVLEVKKFFDFISFTHIYREFNSRADYLSKSAFTLQEGTLLVQEYMEDSLSSKSSLFLFWSNPESRFFQKLEKNVCCGACLRACSVFVVDKLKTGMKGIWTQSAWMDDCNK